MSQFSSSRTSRLHSSRYLRCRGSNSPTLTSTQSEKSIWGPRSYKNQPAPANIRRRLIGKRFQFEQDSQDEQEIIAVQQQQEGENIQKKRRLPIFKVISDWDEFSENRNGRIHSERKRKYSSQRCRSVESLKLPKVEQQKRQDDEWRRKAVVKLTEIRDNNQFGQRRTRRSSSSYTDVVSRVESMQGLQFSGILPQQIIENEAQETKSVKLPNEKSVITAQLQKIIVDQLDEKKKKKQQIHNQQIQSIIEQQKHEQDVDTYKLRTSLEKFQNQSGYLNKLPEESHYKNNQRSSQVVHQQQSEKSD